MRSQAGRLGEQQLPAPSPGPRPVPEWTLSGRSEGLYQAIPDSESPKATQRGCSLEAATADTSLGGLQDDQVPLILTF